MESPRRPAGRHGGRIEAWQKGMARQKGRGSGVGELARPEQWLTRLGLAGRTGKKKDESLVDARLENSLNRATIMLC